MGGVWFWVLRGGMGKGGKQHFEGGVQTREETMLKLILVVLEAGSGNVTRS